MRSLIRPLLFATAAALGAFWLYAFGGAAGQLRALLNSSDERSATTAASATPLKKPAEMPETTGPQGSEAAPVPTLMEPDTRPEAQVEQTPPLSASSGPLSGEDFASLLQSGLLTDVDPEEAEEFLRALREIEPPADR